MLPESCETDSRDKAFWLALQGKCSSMSVQFTNCDRWATTQTPVFLSSIASLKFRNVTSPSNFASLARYEQAPLGSRRQSLGLAHRRLDSPEHTYDQKDKTTQNLLAKHMATQLNQG